MSISLEYLSAVEARLTETAPTLAARGRAADILLRLLRHVRWEDYEVTVTAAELAASGGYDKGTMAKTLGLLEDVGAITRVRRGTAKVITITPEGVYRGNINRHDGAVQRYHLEVIDGGLPGVG